MVGWQCVQEAVGWGSRSHETSQIASQVEGEESLGRQVVVLKRHKERSTIE